LFEEEKMWRCGSILKMMWLVSDEVGGVEMLKWKRRKSSLTNSSPAPRTVTHPQQSRRRCKAYGPTSPGVR